MFRLSLLAIIFTILAGCQSQTLYYWGNYEEQTYDYFKNKPISELIDKLEELKEKALAQEKPLPPTFYAHLGLLYEKSGNTSKFKELLIEEKKRFPESAVFFEMFLKERN
jgi:hypothetical protein